MLCAFGCLSCDVFVVEFLPGRCQQWPSRPTTTTTLPPAAILAIPPRPAASATAATAAHGVYAPADRVCPAASVRQLDGVWRFAAAAPATTPSYWVSRWWSAASTAVYGVPWRGATAAAAATTSVATAGYSATGIPLSSTATATAAAAIHRICCSSTTTAAAAAAVATSPGPGDGNANATCWVEDLSRDGGLV